MKIKNNNISGKLEKVIQKFSFMNKRFQKPVGFRITAYGRDTRKQRASRLSLQYGKVPIRTLDRQISYCERFYTMKFGVYGVRIWIAEKMPVNRLVQINHKRIKWQKQ